MMNPLEGRLECHQFQSFQNRSKHAGAHVDEGLAVSALTGKGIADAGCQLSNLAVVGEKVDASGFLREGEMNANEFVLSAACFADLPHIAFDADVALWVKDDDGFSAHDRLGDLMVEKARLSRAGRADDRHVAFKIALRQVEIALFSEKVDPVVAGRLGDTLLQGLDGAVGTQRMAEAVERMFAEIFTGDDFFSCGR